MEGSEDESTCETEPVALAPGGIGAALASTAAAILLEWEARKVSSSQPDAQRSQPSHSQDDCCGWKPHAAALQVSLSGVRVVLRLEQIG